MVRKDICFLEILNTKKNHVKESCFQNQSIIRLFDIWLDWATTFYNSSIIATIKKEVYNNPEKIHYFLTRDTRSNRPSAKKAILQYDRERDWVLADKPVSTFEKRVFKDVELMTDLVFSLRPDWGKEKNDWVEDIDILNVLSRFTYWLGNVDLIERVQTTGVLIPEQEDPLTKTKYASDAVSSISSDIKIFLSDSSVRYIYTPIHVDSIHWCALLIDKFSSTFEFYDPQSNETIDTIDGLDTLYNIVPDMKLLQFSGENHQRSGTDCGAYILIFLHSRVVLGQTFEEFSDMDIHPKHAAKAREFFFYFPKPEQQKEEDTISVLPYIKFPKYDARLLIVDLIEYISELQIDVLPLERLLKSEKMNQNNVEYIVSTIMNEVYQKTSNISETLVKDLMFEIDHDPLLVYLRGSPQREPIVNKLWKDLTGWVDDTKSSSVMIQLFKTYVSKMIDLKYKKVIKTRKKIDPFNPVLILEMSKTVKGVSVTVHFIRTVEKWLRVNGQMNDRIILLREYTVQSRVIHPELISNVGEMKGTYELCETKLKEARELIEFYNSSENDRSEFTKFLVAQNERDIRSKTIFTNGVKYYNFPFVYSEFVKTYPGFFDEENVFSEKMSAIYDFQHNQISETNFRQLFQDSRFFYYYVFAIHLFNLTLQTPYNRIMPGEILIMAASVHHAYVASNDFQRSILTEVTKHFVRIFKTIDVYKKLYNDDLEIKAIVNTLDEFTAKTDLLTDHSIFENIQKELSALHRQI